MQTCMHCGNLIHPNNYWMADGCPCNSRRGMNHGIVPPDVCTCDVCDPEETGTSRYGRGDPREWTSLRDDGDGNYSVHGICVCRSESRMSHCRDLKDGGVPDPRCEKCAARLGAEKITKEVFELLTARSVIES